MFIQYRWSEQSKKKEQVKAGVDVNAVVTYKNLFVINGKPVTVSLALGEGVVCNAIFSCPLLTKIKASIITYNSYLVSGLLREQFKL